MERKFRVIKELQYKILANGLTYKQGSCMPDEEKDKENTEYEDKVLNIGEIYTLEELQKIQEQVREQQEVFLSETGLEGEQSPKVFKIDIKYFHEITPAEEVLKSLLRQVKYAGITLSGMDNILYYDANNDERSISISQDSKIVLDKLMKEVVDED